MPARELIHSHPPSAEVRNEWSLASTSPAYLFIFSSVDVNKILSTFPHFLNIYEAQKLEENNNIWLLTQNPKHGFMACDPMWFLKMVLTFRRNLLLPSSGYRLTVMCRLNIR
jgi:hypothetical protein